MNDSPWTTEREGQLFPAGPPGAEQVARSIRAARECLGHALATGRGPTPTVLVLRRDVEVLIAAAEAWAKERKP